jgi:2-polyprenyl-3-methyl-5-hydroxy-6-metoxy-1,4-benzoquinol methylase/uncharacterized protein YbaR (Trm112 family)
MAVARPEHLKKLYSEYSKQRSSFALELAELFQLRSHVDSWSNVSVLDIGCGGGQISQAIAALGANVTGIEYSAGRVAAMAADNLNFRLIGGDGHHLPFEARSFDFVILADVLEHVIDPCRMMLEAARVIRSGGLVFVGATNRASIANFLFDPHYNAPLIPLMPKPLATWYVTKFLRLSDSFNVEKYFFRGELLRCLEAPGFSCESLPLYREKILKDDFAVAPGRSFVRTLLAFPGIRPLAVSLAGTTAFEYWIAPGFNLLCRRNKIEGGNGEGALVCSGCHGVLSDGSHERTCRQCGLSFEVRQGIPLMHLPVKT